MKIELVRIENFRAFCYETVELGDYNCFVGRNGSGKSTILYALNVFFRQHKDSSTDLSSLSVDDFHHKNTKSPVRITVTFSDLSEAAREDLADYVRQGKLTVSAVATYNPGTQRAEVRQYGHRLGFEQFRRYFDADKDGAKVADLKEIFSDLRKGEPEVKAASTKSDMTTALQEHEAAHPEKCVLIPSEDQFYGFSKGVNRLAPHLQYVFVPAVKDVAAEADESKDSALGQLLARTVRLRIDFSERVSGLKSQLESQYQAMLDAEQQSLDELSESLQGRLRAWAHPLASAQVLWKQESGKSVKVEEPRATIRLGERDFVGDLPRFGHGLQRSYLLALLQELSELGSASQPTLLMAIEEPELYQHPPQARHLLEVLGTLSRGNAQVLCCSHSPLFIPGDNFEAIRVVRDVGTPCESKVSRVEYAALARDLEAAGQRLLTESGMLAKLYPALNPTLSEMFFCSRLILVEGIEDVAHISAYLELGGLTGEYRRWGCHIVPVGGKSELVKPLAMALRLGLPAYVVFDADTDKTTESEVVQHKKDNRALQLLLGVAEPDEWPGSHLQGPNYYIWSKNLTAAVGDSLGEAWNRAKEQAAQRYGHPGGLAKNPVAIAYAHERAWQDGQRCAELGSLAKSIVEWASTAERG